MKRIIPLLCLLIIPTFAYADNLENLNRADTAWILTSAGLVLFMTLPGLTLFYGGMVHRKNVLTIVSACFAMTGLISIIWAAFGYSLALTDGGALQPFIGGFSQVLLLSMTESRLYGSIPESVFIMYHLTFAIFTPALIVGSLVERVKFFPLLAFAALWEILVYIPVCHWIWGNGWLAELGVMDFAGGMVVHGSAGIAALVGAIVIGPRRGFPNRLLIPHNLAMTTFGAGILWVGWHGFSAGSALMATGAAGMAMLSTHVCASASTVTWIILDWMRFGKPTVLGAVTGMIAGLSMISSGAGYVSPLSALFIGIIAGICCFYSVYYLKNRFKIDDVCDVFPVHGTSGLIGSMLTAIFADEFFGGYGIVSENGIMHQFFIQALGVTIVLVWSATISYLLFKFLDSTVGIRVSEENEISGLDIALHDQQGYDL